MVSTYLSIVLREGMARIAREHPTLDWSLVPLTAQYRLDAAITRWREDPAARLADVRAAFAHFERELLAANRIQFDLFAERKAG